MMRQKEHLSYSGALLAAHPVLEDPNFARSVVLISAHSSEKGALGVILNRPTGKTLGQIDGQFVYSPLGKAPLYKGGPVAPEQLTFMAWYLSEASGVFRLYFGLSQWRAQEIIENEPKGEVRCFLGYSGWQEGQLEDELKQNTWIIAPINKTLLTKDQGDLLWRQILNATHPELRFWFQRPADPSLN